MPNRKTSQKSDQDKLLVRRNLIITSVVGITVILTFILELPPKISAAINVLKITDTPVLTNTPEPSTTFTPVPTNTEAPTPMFTIEPSSTSQPTNAPSQTPTFTPVPTIEPKVFRGIDRNCIDKKYWYPKPIYPSDKLTQDKNGCWNLSSWGILAENQAIKFIVQDNEFDENIARSIYTFIDDKATIIQFKVKVDELTSASNLYGSLFIGLGNKANFTKPGFFVSFTAPVGKNKTFLETSSEYYLKYLEPRVDYTLGEVLTIKIVIMNPYVSIRVDGSEIRGLNLDVANREVLWIGYTTHSTGNYITAEIFDFSISER